MKTCQSTSEKTSDILSIRPLATLDSTWKQTTLLFKLLKLLSKNPQRIHLRRTEKQKYNNIETHIKYTTHPLTETKVEITLPLPVDAGRVQDVILYDNTNPNFPSKVDDVEGGGYLATANEIISKPIPTASWYHDQYDSRNGLVIWNHPNHLNMPSNHITQYSQ